MGPTLHRHLHKDFWELLLVTQGAMRVSTLKKESQGVVGSIYIRPPGVAHQEWCISAVKLELQVVIWRFPRPVKINRLPAEGFDSTGHITNGLDWLEELQQGLGPRHPMQDKLLELILLECARPAQPLATHKFSKVLDHIQQNLAQPLTVGQLAEIASMSESHFSHEFHLEIGFSPMAYVRKTRLDQACKAITQTDTVLREIAREAGFRDEIEFSRVFRRIMGISPSSLRTRHHRPKSPE